MMRLIVLSLILSVSLAACAQSEKPNVITQTRVVKPDIPIQAKPRPVTTRDVNFWVVTEENFEEFKAEFIAEGNEFVFVAISIGDYEDLSLNLADIKRYIEQQNEIIVFYEAAVK